MIFLEGKYVNNLVDCDREKKANNYEKNKK